MSGIYIHIPFCKQACHYCDFHFSTSMEKKEAMLGALEKELMLRKGEFANEEVETIYFGGGTPSVLTSMEIKQLIDAVYANYTVSEDPEITLEANPDDLTNITLSTVEGLGTNVFEVYLQAGINRLSIGIQSFFEEDLKLMNRAHNAQEAQSSIREASKYFNNISIDLIYGMPDMSDARWRENIQKALSFGVPHISSYALTVEPKTALARFIEKGVVAPLDDEVAQAHFNILLKEMEAAGFESYEISNFGKPGYFSKNNTAYWQQKKYIGIGPSAHSYDGVRRGWNINNNPKYIKSIGKNELPMEVEVLSNTDKYNEYVMTGLRTIWGVSLEKINAENGPKFKEYALQQAQKHIEEHLLYIDNDTLLATKKGRFLADGIAADLFMVNLS
ncbi:radical SAM family heme chaperone HemW [Aggregatimonas sangjinii]|uniref:Heme chaperone HemW n=1 Tax=Aggregatimonas sangjinii TaxID=2583587 RepID=A0A5B7SX45_9FLAO|nr:radical SAM family heme chaperone HemW [Aggregatimonas sangjinii]QCX01304.1 radical SAM family heme chaperone HemW [Aggregatimonas sangjinii]